MTLTASAVFIATIGLDHWEIVLALALGGVCAAPLAGLIAPLAILHPEHPVRSLDRSRRAWFLHPAFQDASGSAERAEPTCLSPVSH